MRSIISHSFSRLSKTISKFYIPILFILLLIAVSSISVSFTKTSAQEQPPVTNSAAPSPVQAKLCCGQEKDQPHFLAASYYKVGNNLTATLMLNNKGPEPVEVKPTLFSLSGERLEVSPVIVEGESFRNIDLKEFGALPGTIFEEGSLQLFHKGPDLVIGAQLYMVDESHSLSFDEKLVEFQTVPSTQLESVWWLPSRESKVSLILSNTSDQEISANALINAGTPHPETVDVTLSPHETRVIKVERGKPGRGERLRDDVGSASIHHTGEKGSLVARALIEDSTRGYSFSAQFYYPQGGRSSGYQGVGLRLSTGAGEKLTPVIVARNVGDVPTDLSGRLPYTTTDGTVGVVQLGKMKLAAGEAASVDVERAVRNEIRTKKIAAASLEFDYTTAPGSVVMAAESVSADGNQVFRVPMWDVPAQRNGTGGYPWFIEGDSSTFIYIKNVTDKEQHYTFSLTYDGGDYSTGLKSIKAGETVVFDLRAMRDSQIPDERGKTIPLNAKRGKIVWSVRGPDSLALLGRSEQVDLAKGTSSSYACFMCCPNSVRRTWVEPYLLDIDVGDITTFQGKEQDSTCYGGLIPAYYMGDVWSVDDVNVATVEGTGSAADVTGADSGSTSVIGHWSVYSYTVVLDFETGYKRCEESEDVTEPESELGVRPRITSITPSRGAINAKTTVTIQGSGFSSSATVNTGSGITASITSRSATSITVELTVASTATGGNHGITVTSNGKTSNSKDFFVQIPSKLLPLNIPVVAPNGIGPLKTPVNENVVDLGGRVVFQNYCGVYRNYAFFLADQEGERIFTTFTLDEVFSDYSSPAGFPPPPFTPSTIGPNDNIGDIQPLGFTYPNCLLPGDTQTFTQQFTITIGTEVYHPTTKIKIERGNFGGTLKVDRTILTP